MKLVEIKSNGYAKLTPGEEVALQTFKRVYKKLVQEFETSNNKLKLSIGTVYGRHLYIKTHPSSDYKTQDKIKNLIDDVNVAIDAAGGLTTSLKNALIAIVDKKHLYDVKAASDKEDAKEKARYEKEKESTVNTSEGVKNLVDSYVKQKGNVIINYNGIHAGSYDTRSVKSNIKAFDTFDDMVTFLRTKGEWDATESRIASFDKLSDKDLKKLGLEKSDVNYNDLSKYKKAIKALSNAEYMSLDGVKNTFMNGDVDDDNYDWAVLAMNGRKFMLNYSGFINHEFRRLDDY